MNTVFKDILEMEKLEVSLAQQHGSILSEKEALVRAIERIGIQGILSLRSNILIEECGEDLVEIPHFLIREKKHPYIKAGAPYGEFSPFFLRESLITALLKARRRLQEIDPELDLLFYDGFRPISVQQFMICKTFIAECAKINTSPNKINFAQKNYLLDIINNIWATPTQDNNLPPPPHSTGAAVDVTLIRRKGDAWEEVFMGAEYDSLPPESLTYHYHRKFEILDHQINNLSQDILNPIMINERENSKVILNNRNILQEAMSSVGFFNLGSEFWHFSLGDQVASLLEGFHMGVYKSAKYGRINCTLEGEPSKNTLELYNQMFPEKSPGDKTHQQILNEMIHFIYN